MNDKIKTILTDNLKSLYSNKMEDYYELASLLCIKNNPPKMIFHNDINKSPYYDVKIDTIFLAPFISFNPFDYYHDMTHEVVHSTGHTDRLNRIIRGDGKPNNQYYYALEEIIAQYATAMIMVSCGFKNIIEPSIIYIETYYGYLEYYEENFKDANCNYTTKSIYKAIEYSKEAYEYIVNTS